MKELLTSGRTLNKNTSDPFWLQYFNSLDTIYRDIEFVLGEINTQVSYHDYSLRTQLGPALIDYSD